VHTPDSAAWLRLTLTPGLGNGARRALLRAFGLPEAIFAAPRSRLAAVCGDVAAASLLDAPHATVADLLERTGTWLRERPGACLISLADADYPPPLLHLADPPLLLYAQGRRMRARWMRRGQPSRSWAPASTGSIRRAIGP